MSKSRVRQIERRIALIKEALSKIGPMRPGTLTLQYKKPQDKSGPYWQLSYTRKMKSKSEYVRPAWVPNVRKEIAAYKRFKTLMDKWIELGIEASKLNMRLDNRRGSE
ncbi:MAG: DUF6788 family protein [Chloroflexota bacterium]